VGEGTASGPGGHEEASVGGTRVRTALKFSRGGPQGGDSAVPSCIVAAWCAGCATSTCNNKRHHHSTGHSQNWKHPTYTFNT
jgi:hypothetical protein